MGLFYDLQKMQSEGKKVVSIEYVLNSIQTNEKAKIRRVQAKQDESIGREEKRGIKQI